MELKPIELLGVLTMTRHDLLNRLIDNIDYPINKMVILSQGKLDLNELHTNNTLIKNYIVLEASHNIGVARGWNYIMKNYESPYWLIVGDDIYFDKGSLQKLAIKISLEPNILNSVLINFMWNGHSSLFTSFIFTKKTIETVGYFDENIYPAYFEDNDIAYRMVLSGGSLITLNDVIVFHGDDKHNQACTFESLKTEQRKILEICIQRNREYMMEKWNSLKIFGKVYENDGFKHPFNVVLYNFKDQVKHNNYYENQKILLGHVKEPIIKKIN